MDAEEISAQAHRLGRDGFIARNPHLFLVLRANLASAPLPFATASVHLSASDRQQLVSGKSEATKRCALEIVPVIKAENNPYLYRISVGRARNCDVVLRDESVSKLHAHFLADEQAGGRIHWSLVDLRSGNGTRVNGKRLNADQPQPVVSDDVLQFGSLHAELVDAGALYDLLA